MTKTQTSAYTRRYQPAHLLSLYGYPPTGQLSLCSPVLLVPLGVPPAQVGGVGDRGREVLEGGGAGGLGPRSLCTKNGPTRFFPMVNFVLSHDGPFGLEGGRSRGGGGPPPTVYGHSNTSLGGGGGARPLGRWEGVP